MQFMNDDRRLIVIFETHSTTFDNEAGIASGWFDVRLSPRGEEQARDLGVRRRGDRLAAVFCSDFRRAIQTADIAFGDRGVPIVHDQRLREVDYGALTRRPAGEIDAQRMAYLTSPFPGGESYEQAVQRVAGWLEDASRVHPDGTVLVIGHRATFYALEHLAGRIPLDEVVAAPWRWQPGWTYRVSGTVRPSS
jgi:alpha-ribazole phosphatase/probable phosphoglycerate mutase